LQHPILNTDPRIDLAASAALLMRIALGRAAGLLHAARFDRRRSLQALQTRNLRTLLDNCPLQFGDFAQQAGHQFP